MLNIHSDFIKNNLKEIGPNAYAILCVISNYMNKKSEAWPSVDTIKKTIGIGKDTIYKNISVLIDKGMIERVEFRNKGKFSSNKYKVTTGFIKKYCAPLTDLSSTVLPCTDSSDTVLSDTIKSTLSIESNKVLLKTKVLLKEEKEKKEKLNAQLSALSLENERLKKEKAELGNTIQALQAEIQTAEQKEKSSAKKEKKICQVRLEAMSIDNSNKTASNFNDNTKARQIDKSSKNNSNTGQNKPSKKITDKDRPATDSKYYAEVIRVLNYLKAKAGYNYRMKQSKWTMDRYGPRKKIVHLLDNGADIMDFQKIIDLKCAEWKGNPKMARYLNPDTLFGSENFEKYLNQYYQAQNAKNHAQQVSSNNKSKAEIRRAGGISEEFDQAADAILDAYGGTDGTEFLEQLRKGSYSSNANRAY